MTSESEGIGAMQWAGAVDGICRKMKRGSEVNGMCMRKKSTWEWYRMKWRELGWIGIRESCVVSLCRASGVLKGSHFSKMHIHTWIESLHHVVQRPVLLWYANAIWDHIYVSCKHRTIDSELFCYVLILTPTERPPPVGEIVPTFAGRGVSRGQRNESPRPFSV